MQLHFCKCVKCLLILQHLKEKQYHHYRKNKILNKRCSDIFVNM